LSLECFGEFDGERVSIETSSMHSSCCAHSKLPNEYRCLDLWQLIDNLMHNLMLFNTQWCLPSHGI